MSNPSNAIVSRHSEKVHMGSMKIEPISMDEVSQSHSSRNSAHGSESISAVMRKSKTKFLYYESLNVNDVRVTELLQSREIHSFDEIKRIRLEAK